MTLKTQWTSQLVILLFTVFYVCYQIDSYITKFFLPSKVQFLCAFRWGNLLQSPSISKPEHGLRSSSSRVFCPDANAANADSVHGDAALLRNQITYRFSCLPLLLQVLASSLRLQCWPADLMHVLPQNVELINIACQAAFSWFWHQPINQKPTNQFHVCRRENWM